jgi:hypothetical protein
MGSGVLQGRGEFAVVMDGGRGKSNLQVGEMFPSRSLR